MTAATWIGVGLLGGAGAVLRFALDAAISARITARFPLGTLAVNLSGAVTLGLLAGLALRGDLRLLIGTALLGSYTTFSTWMLETHRLGEGRETAALWANLIVSLLLGLAAATAGHAIGAAL